MANTLLCTEKIDARRAEIDPVIFGDQRVMDNLIAAERKSMITVDYFAEVQMDITSHMRHIVVEWMMEVCEEVGCENPVFPLAVRLLDQFLACCNTSRQHLQLLGAVCIHVATKVRQVTPASTEMLIYYTDNSINAMDMLRVELMLLLQLDWQVSQVTAADFLEHVLCRVPWAQESPHLRRHAHLLLQLCVADHEMIRLRPAAVASGCLMAAARGLRIPSMSKVTGHVCSLTRVPESAAVDVEERVEALVRQEEARHLVQRPSPATSVPHTSPQSLKSSSTVPMSGNGSLPLDILIDDSMDQTSQPETPTDVQDIHF